MSENTEKNGKTDDNDKAGQKPAALSGKKGTLSLSGTASAKARQAVQGQSAAVVEIRSRGRAKPGAAKEAPDAGTPEGDARSARNLTAAERESRAQALRRSLSAEEGKETPAGDRPGRASPGQGTTQGTRLDQRKKELEELERIEREERLRAEAAAGRENKPGAEHKFTQGAGAPGAGKQQPDEKDKRDALKRAPSKTARMENKRRSGKLTVTQVLNEDYNRDRGPSLAAQRRAREKARMAAQGSKEPAQKIYHEVTLPEAITVQELANRMAERSGDVIKTLIKLGVMATINQTIDADTAELVIHEFGHSVRRVTDADIEIGLESDEDTDEALVPRPPVVTVMGHVDHGKTSLLDALRQTDVVGGEAGGITQHIGAYQITMSSGEKITFLDTPGHAAFTEMRARGANVTDIVVLVVSANDSVMPQTVEAINHAKAANVPIVVAVTKSDLPDANPQKIRQDLLQYDVITEDIGGGDVLAIDVSAKTKQGLKELEEAILLQAEMLDLTANPDRAAQAAVVEAKMEPGRGSVATVLVQKGTLKIGDVFVVGAEIGRVRALIDSHGAKTDQAVPGEPVEILGLNGTPEAGDMLYVVEDENRARQISDYRRDKKREKKAMAVSAGRSLDDMLAAAQKGERKLLPLVIKGDVHGSVEAIIGSLNKMTEENEEIGVQILHSGAGGITETDVTLARASNGLILGFNVRANTQARDQAQRENVDIRYYNVIYDAVDDVKAILGGMLAPAQREEYLGQAEIREVFNISKVGKIAGCMVTAGQVKRGAKVRLLRDDVVIHEGTLKTLKRFKDEVKEVKEGTECGMAFENYDDVKQGDVIECYEIIEEARQLD